MCMASGWEEFHCIVNQALVITLLMLSCLLAFFSDVKSEHEVLAYLRNGTLVGLLPVPHPIIIRKYQASEATELWFHTYIWGVVYVRYVQVIS